MKLKLNAARIDCPVNPELPNRVPSVVVRMSHPGTSSGEPMCRPKYVYGAEREMTGYLIPLVVH
jgi:hypothetical protein